MTPDALATFSWTELRPMEGSAKALGLGHQKKPRNEPCPRGRDRSREMSVVCGGKSCPERKALHQGSCVPKDRHVGWGFDDGIIDLASAIVSLALFILALRFVWKRWRAWRGHTSDVNLKEALPAGRLVSSGTSGWGDLGWGNRRKGFLVPRQALGHHIVIAGGTGSGKTNSTEVLEFGAATSYRPQIIHFDCKGSRTGMARFVALMGRAGYGRIRLFPVESYDGWRGGAEPGRALLARLVQIQDWSESFYAAGTKDLLQRTLATGVPSCSAEFVAQLERLASSNGNAKLIEGAQARYRGFFNGLGGVLDGSWAYEDCDACYVQLEGFGLASEANALGRFLLEDLTHYLSERKDPTREVLLVLDEFSAISQGADAANLIERAREFGCGVILTTQSYAGLGAGAERVLDAARGALIVHSLANPEPFTQRAGTVEREVQSVTQPQNQPGLLWSMWTGKPPEQPRTTTRLQDFPRIDPNDVRQLGRGQACVISGGRAQRVEFHRVELDAYAIEEAQQEIAHRSAPAASAQIPERSRRPPANLDF